MPTRPRPPAVPDVPRAPDTRRKVAARGYGSLWRRLRLLILAGEPLCRHCKARGHVTAAALVDHVRPIEDGGGRLDPANLQPLCVPCHAAKTASDIAARRASCPPSTSR